MNKLAILLWSVDLDRPDLAAAPFVYAAAASALDAEVEVHFAGRSVRLLIDSNLLRQGIDGGSERSLYAFMQDAASGGARFLACSMAWRAYVGEGEPLIPEFSGQAGATAFVARSLDPDWRTLVF
ncbi:MAG: DsrE family protein [Zoogloeaceae bacterium]|nr:DsrE family protein [Zoogloeaceae bacterium]